MGCTGRDPAAIAETAARAAVLAELNAGIEATRMKNVDGYLDQIPDEVLVRGPDGRPLSRDSIRAQVTRAWASIERTRDVSVTLDLFVFHGDSATVYTTQHWDRLVFGAERGHLDTVVSDTKQREIWRRTAKGWRSFSATPINRSTTVNGKHLIEAALPKG